MFGWTLIRKEELSEILDESILNACTLHYLRSGLRACSEELEEAKLENKRLFDLHNKRLTKPKRDKNGRYRGRDGKFAKATK